jgi:hypothetical protein
MTDIHSHNHGHNQDHGSGHSGSGSRNVVCIRCGQSVRSGAFIEGIYFRKTHFTLILKHWGKPITKSTFDVQNAKKI